MSGNNPVPNSEATRFRAGEEQAEIAKMGGIASGEARRKKRTVLDMLQAIMDGTLQGSDKTGAEAFALKLYAQFMKEGDVSAARLIMSYLYGQPPQAIDVAHKGDVSVNISFCKDKEELDKWK